MNYPIFFEAKNSLKLFGLQDEFKFLTSLYKKSKLPKVLLFSGRKGSGKSTLINHFLFSIFDEENYSYENNILENSSNFYNLFQKDIFSNIIYLNGSNYSTVKIDDIRELKNKIFQSTISEKDRFIILDDIDLFNSNSLNALLKIIEEPNKKNFFFLIDNKSKPLLETIKSRSLEIKIILSENKRLEIINSLIVYLKTKVMLDAEKSKLSPGNFIKFNYICTENNICFNNEFISNLSLLLNLYKKKKDILFINIAFFLADHYFQDLHNRKKSDKVKIYENKDFILKNLNNFLIYNMNPKSLINAIVSKLNYE